MRLQAGYLTVEKMGLYMVIFYSGNLMVVSYWVKTKPSFINCFWHRSTKLNLFSVLFLRRFLRSFKSVRCFMNFFLVRCCLEHLNKNILHFSSKYVWNSAFLENVFDAQYQSVYKIQILLEVYSCLRRVKMQYEINMSADGSSFVRHQSIQL